MKPFLPLIVTVEGADESGLEHARNGGGRLRLEGDSVAAYAGWPPRRLGYVRCRDIRKHMTGGGSASFCYSDGSLSLPNTVVCSLQD